MKKKGSLASRLHEIEVGIAGVRNNPEIQELMVPYGYTPERIAEGSTMLLNVRQLEARQAEKNSDRLVANDEFRRLRSSCYACYIATLRVTRIAFRTLPGRLQEIRAVGKRRRSLAGWLDDARLLYTNLETPAMMTEMVKFGYSAERLHQEWQQVEQVTALHGKRLQELGAAQVSTVERDRLIDELCEWYSDFRAIVRVAMRSDPQKMEALGIVT
jgi:hypothetical protein